MMQQAMGGGGGGNAGGSGGSGGSGGGIDPMTLMMMSQGGGFGKIMIHRAVHNL